MLRHYAARLPLALFAGIVLVFLFAPVVVMALVSFNGAERLTLPLQGISLRWYRVVLDNPSYTQPLRNSAIVACVTAVFSLALGTLAAIAVAKASPRPRTLLSALFFVPIAVPALFIALALATFFGHVKLPFFYPFSLHTVIAAHFLATFPFFVLIAQAALDRLDPQLGEVGADLGANPWRQFSRVTLPLVWPMLGAATLFVVALSFDEFIRTFFVIGSESTVPMFLWSRMRTTVDPSVNALATLLLLINIFGTLIAGLVFIARGLLSRPERL